MRLVCPKCSSQYEVDASLFPDEGREVQCSSCEEVWVQYPVADPEPPMRLDAPQQPAPRPSERLDEDEREALRDAVAEEIEAQQNRGYQRRSNFIDDAIGDDDLDDDEIVRALREQIKAEGGDFAKTKGEAKSQKRNLRVAAEAVGVDVDRVEDDSSRRKWNLSSHDGKRQQAAGGRRDGLKEAVRRYEEEVGPMRPRRPMRRGFLAALVLVAIGAGIFAGRQQIAEAYPPAAPYLDQYAEAVAQARLKAEELYAQYQPIIMEKIAELTGDADAESAAQ